MKKVFVASISKTKFDAISYSDDTAGVFKFIKELGYDAIELGIRNPLEINADELIKLSEHFDLPVAALATGQAYVDERISLTEEDKDTQRKAIDRIKSHIDLGERLNAPVIIGLMRGNPSKSGVREALSILQRNMNICLDYAEKHSTEIFLEPVNRYESSIINTLAEGVEFVKQFSSSMLKVLMDTFHMNIEEADMAKSIEDAFPYIGHVHAADSNRLAPGQGHIDFDSIFKKLASKSYNGYISAEILPKPNFYKAAELSIEFFRSKELLL
ncbi:MAG: sugar phosphate isomerase/epimerase [Spirochaetales bacterium]|nr:sugar phosphate isomerase/epimerase [Spirochaetales bacterium]